MRCQWAKEPRLVLTNSHQPGPSPLGTPPQSLELLQGPPDQVLVDAPCDAIQPGAVERPVVVDPAPNLRIDVPGEPGQVRSAATVEVPVPDLLALRLHRLIAHGRKEAHKEAPPTTDDTAPEGVAEEVEDGVLRLLSAVCVPAVHDPRLHRVHFEPNGPQA